MRTGVQNESLCKRVHIQDVHLKILICNNKNNLNNHELIVLVNAASKYIHLNQKYKNGQLSYMYTIKIFKNNLFYAQQFH